MSEEKNKKKFYITTTLPYVNASPHVGFATEIIRADVFARYKESLGYEVFFNTGTDEHGQKIWQVAEEEKIPVQDYVDRYAKKFLELGQLLNLKENLNFIRTTDLKHIEAAQNFWRICNQAGYIYKKNYQSKYCVGCELEKKDSDLVDGRCPLHPKKELELIDEENYFFKFSEFKQKLLKLYQDNPQLVIPDVRLNEIKSFVEQGLQDFSISRQKTKMPWGIEVPDDPDHVMYVWFDALVNYISTLDWPKNVEKFRDFWGQGGAGDIGQAVQICGKDNLRQQSAIWQAMLMSVNLPATKNIIIDGFITGQGGIKMSKSLGNVIDPVEVVNQYGCEALRFFVCHDIHPFEDSPFSLELFKESYNANLVNGLGNLVSRIMKMSSSYNIQFSDKLLEKSDQKEIDENLENFRIDLFLQNIWKKLKELDVYIQKEEPFKKIKTDEAGAKKDLEYLLKNLYLQAEKIQPVMPETSNKIIQLIRQNKNPEAPLFPRK